MPSTSDVRKSGRNAEVERRRCERGVFPMPAVAPLASVATAFSLSARFVIQRMKSYDRKFRTKKRS
ncbi:MAG: hypothetical protein V1688_01885 [bacterium]